MAAIVYSNDQRFKVSQGLVAHVHALTTHVFPKGKGFSLGFFGADDEGNPIRKFMWLHPSIPVQFVYDDDEETVILNREYFTRHLDLIDETASVNFYDDSDWLPFVFPLEESEEPA